MLNVKIRNESNNPLPVYQTELSAGMDLHANLGEPIPIEMGQRTLIPTGLFLELPAGFEAQIRPRSGLALKHGITVLNTPGTLDADYRGEVKVLLINHGNEPFTVNHGERIAQMVVAKHETVTWEVTHELTDTTRGAGGYGSSGK